MRTRELGSDLGSDLVEGHLCSRALTGQDSCLGLDSNILLL